MFLCVRAPRAPTARCWPEESHPGLPPPSSDQGCHRSSGWWLWLLPELCPGVSVPSPGSQGWRPRLDLGPTLTGRSAGPVLSPLCLPVPGAVGVRPLHSRWFGRPASLPLGRSAALAVPRHSVVCLHIILPSQYDHQTLKADPFWINWHFVHLPQSSFHNST